MPLFMPFVLPVSAFVALPIASKRLLDTDLAWLALLLAPVLLSLPVLLLGAVSGAGLPYCIIALRAAKVASGPLRGAAADRACVAVTRRCGESEAWTICPDKNLIGLIELPLSHKSPLHTNNNINK